MKVRALRMFINIIILFVTIQPVQSSDKMNIAIIDLDISNIDYRIQKPLSDRLRAELFKTGRFNVMERDKMENILSEQGFQQTGCTSNECIVEAGRLLGVERMIAGSLGKVGTIYTISLRLIDLETGKIILSKTEDCNCPIETVLTKTLKMIAFKIAGFSSKGKLDITGNPQGAEVYISGQKIGELPIDGFQLEKGLYDIKIKNSGYETYTERINIIPNSNNSVMVKLIPKSRSKAIRRSFLIPGSGQYYLDRKGRAFLYPVLEIAAIAGAYVYNTKYNDLSSEYDLIRNNYSNAISENDIDYYFTQMENKFDEVDLSQKLRNTFISLSIGIWIINVFDAALTDPIKLKNQSKTFSIHSKQIDNRYLIGLNVNF